VACAGSPAASATPTPKPAGGGVTASQGVYPQDVTIAGFFSGHISSGYGACVKTSEGFQGYVQDQKAGSPLRFDFKIDAVKYHGPGTYGPREGNALLGTVYMAGQLTWSAESGTFTVDPGEKGGSLRMHLTSGGGAGGSTEDLSGRWRCG